MAFEERSLIQGEKKIAHTKLDGGGRGGRVVYCEEVRMLVGGQ